MRKAINDSQKSACSSRVKAKAMPEKSRKITSWYHFQASGLMGSPTVPRMRRDFREYFVTKLSPKDCSALMAVGAVYSSVTCRQPDASQSSAVVDMTALRNPALQGFPESKEVLGCAWHAQMSHSTCAGAALLIHS